MFLAELWSFEKVKLLFRAVSNACVWKICIMWNEDWSHVSNAEGEERTYFFIPYELIPLKTDSTRDISSTTKEVSHHLVHLWRLERSVIKIRTKGTKTTL